MWLVLSVAFTVKLDVPAEADVPEMTPAGLSARPAGKAPALIVQV